MQTPILSVKSLRKTYESGNRALTVLEDITFDLETASTNAIVGPSGSGKTTLLGLCAGLDRPSEGEIWLNGQALHGMTEDELAQTRNQYIGFIFQSFQLLPTLTAIENVMVPMELRGATQPRKEALDLLDRVGLADRAHHYPIQLSGGEQQRVAMARAFINQPTILFADEPTGNLDDDTGQTVESLLFDLNKDQQTTLVVVTHDLELAGKTQRIIRLKGGKLAA